MQSPNHILAQEGVLTSFSIAKKVTIKDVKKLRNQLRNKKNMNRSDINGLVRQTIIEETQKAVEQNAIPGLINSGTNNAANAEEKKRLMEFTYFASLVAKKMAEKCSDKYYCCYVVNAIVNMLGLKEEDFDEFHRRFSEFQEGENNDQQ